MRPARSDVAYKIVRHCASLSHNRIAVFAEDDAIGRAGMATVTQALADLERPALVASALSPVNGDKVDTAVATLLKPTLGCQSAQTVQLSGFYS